MRKALIILLLMASMATGSIFLGLPAILSGVVESQYQPNRFAADGSNTTFTFDFTILLSDDIEVRLIDDSTGVGTLLTLTTDYSLSATNNNFSGGGTITTVQTYNAGFTILATRSSAQTQETNFQRGQPIPPEILEGILDRQTMNIQDISAVQDRSILAPIEDDSPNMRLPSAINRADSTLGFDENGDVTVVSGVLSEVSVTPFMTTLLDDVNAPDARVTLGFLSNTFWNALIQDANATDAQLTLGLLDEDDMTSDDPNVPASQQSVKAFVTSGTVVMSNKTLTSPVLNTSVSGSAILDEDNMVSDSATQIATQQSIKAYVDTKHTAAGTWQHDGSALNGGNAVDIPTAGTYVSVDTGIGSRALCYVRVQNVTGGDSACTVRDADENVDFGHEKFSDPCGSARVFAGDDEYGVVVVECNASGNIEITGDSNGDDWKLWLMGYVK